MENVFIMVRLVVSAAIPDQTDLQKRLRRRRLFINKELDDDMDLDQTDENKKEQVKDLKISRTSDVYLK